MCVISALALWPVLSLIKNYKLYILYINRYMNIYSIQGQGNKRTQEKLVCVCAVGNDRLSSLLFIL